MCRGLHLVIYPTKVYFLKGQNQLQHLTFGTQKNKVIDLNSLKLPQLGAICLEIIAQFLFNIKP